MVSLIHAASKIQLRQNNNNWPQPPILWCAVVGRSGENKTAPCKAAREFPKAVERAWHTEYRRALEAKEFSKDQAKRQDQKTISPSLTDADFEAEPKFRQKITSDATTEAMSLLLAENPSGVLLVRRAHGFFRPHRRIFNPAGKGPTLLAGSL